MSCSRAGVKQKREPPRPTMARFGFIYRLAKAVALPMIRGLTEAGDARSCRESIETVTELTPRPGLDTLTQRERECLRLLFGGLRAKEIGAALGVSDATVNNHLASARRKLGTSDSREAARPLRPGARKPGSERLAR